MQIDAGYFYFKSKKMKKSYGLFQLVQKLINIKKYIK